MAKARFVTFLILLIFPQIVHSAVISGTVRSKATGEPLAKANVVILDTPFRASTDLDGKYVITFVPPLPPPDRYTVAATMLGYEEQRATNIAALKGTIIRIDFDLEPTALELEEVIIDAGAKVGTEERELEDRLATTVITDALTSETMRGLPDPDIASVVRWDTGVSTMGGDPIIRGLGVRYSKVTLHGAYLSGTGPNRSAVSLELFPANMMQQVTVSKSYTPDQFGELGGGVINMNTQEFLSNEGQNTSASTSYNTLTTYQDFLTYQGGDWDFLGFDDGTRALPSAIDNLNTKIEGLPSSEIEYLGESLPNI